MNALLWKAQTLEPRIAQLEAKVATGNLGTYSQPVAPTYTAYTEVVFNTLVDLKNTPTPSTRLLGLVLDRGDGSAARYVWLPASTATADAVSTILPLGQSALTPGRWVLTI